MSSDRIQRILTYTDAMVHCYRSILSEDERLALHQWEASDNFTSTDEWPGWVQHLGLSPCMTPPKPCLLQRRA